MIRGYEKRAFAASHYDFDDHDTGSLKDVIAINYSQLNTNLTQKVACLPVWILKGLAGTLFFWLFLRKWSGTDCEIAKRFCQFPRII
mgnify:CR=1 FL=1